MPTTRAQGPLFPPKKRPEHTINRTQFAGPYLSSFTQKAHEQLLGRLKHVNCSYLSPSDHHSVTLNDLKKHAQALTVLIRHLSVSTTYGVVDNANNGGESFVDSQAFDWLNDLNKPYRNDDESHQLPLTSLMNQLLDRDQQATEQHNADREYVHACPMMRTEIFNQANQRLLPLATHQLLVEHANEILERLDHEFSGAGGLLGMLPATGFKPEETERTATQTILGQWIAFTRSLVLRCHDLEISYANALDVVAGEACIPREILSEVGSIGRQPQPVSYAQDRFILCNVQNGRWEWLNDRLKAKEMNEPAENILYHVEVPTRYYQLRGEPTVFVVPQWAGTRATRQLEQRPTVVQVVKPTWGTRASAWEEKHEQELQRLRLYEPEVERLTRENKELREDIEVLAHEKKLFEVERRLWREAAIDGVPDQIAEAVAGLQKLDEDRKKLDARQKDFDKRKEALVEMTAATEEWIAKEKRRWREANAPKAEETVTGGSGVGGSNAGFAFDDDSDDEY